MEKNGKLFCFFNPLVSAMMSRQFPVILQLATLAGPLAGEELDGICFLLERVEILQDCLAGTAAASQSPPPQTSSPDPGTTQGTMIMTTKAPAHASIPDRKPDGDISGSFPLDQAWLSRESHGKEEGMEGGKSICGVGQGEAARAESESVDAASTRGSSVSRGGQQGTARHQRRRFGPLSGQIISISRMGCRASMLCCPVRLVEAFYRCR